DLLACEVLLVLVAVARGEREKHAACRRPRESVHDEPSVLRRLRRPSIPGRPAPPYVSSRASSTREPLADAVEQDARAAAVILRVERADAHLDPRSDVAVLDHVHRRVLDRDAP